MPHLLSEEAQSDIKQEEQQAGSEVEAMAAQAKAEAEAPPPEAPSSASDVIYRLAHLEASLNHTQEELAAALRVIAEQEQELAGLKSEEEDLEEVAVGEAEEECSKTNPPAWCHLLAGQKKRR